jgi:hypothetical protein
MYCKVSDTSIYEKLKLNEERKASLCAMIVRRRRRERERGRSSQTINWFLKARETRNFSPPG